MSLSILHELDHPTHALTANDTDSLVLGAQAGAEAAQLSSGKDYLDIVGEELAVFIGPTQNAREFFVGHAIGVRAGILELDVEAASGSGFQISGWHEIDVLRTAKRLAAGSSADQEDNFLPFDRTLSAAVQQRRGHSGRASDEPAEFIGLAIGLRHAELSAGVAV